jgi:hypothetical protein
MDEDQSGALSFDELYRNMLLVNPSLQSSDIRSGAVHHPEKEEKSVCTQAVTQAHEHTSNTYLHTFTRRMPPQTCARRGVQ